MIDQLHYISQQQENLGHLEAIELALESGCKWIQLRVKKQPENEVRALAEKAKQLCDRYNSRLIINDFPHIAKEVNAHGVHLGLQDMPITEARKITGPEMIIGGTANTIEQVLQRVQEGADYVGVGPYRFTTTKENLSPILGLQGNQAILARLKELEIDIPLIAIGGILTGDIEELVKAGVFGVAVSGLITNSKNRKETVAEILAKLRTTGVKAQENELM